MYVKQVIRKVSQTAEKNRRITFRCVKEFPFYDSL